MNKYEHYKKLSCPSLGWEEFVSYESAWNRHLCEPDPENIYVVLKKLKKAESRVSWLEFQMRAARDALSSSFGHR